VEIHVRQGMTAIHPTYGKGTVIKVDTTFYTIHFPNRGNLDISKRTEGLEFAEDLVDPAASDETLDMPLLERTLRHILTEYSDIQQTVQLGDRWQGGTMILQPADKDLKAKEIPLETFFHKIVMLRDRLRVLEQNINSHKGLTDEEKIDLQQYITRCYGSLTTFNILFKDPAHQFVGEKKS
jgi:hypothetical protein